MSWLKASGRPTFLRRCVLDRRAGFLDHLAGNRVHNRVAQRDDQRGAVFRGPLRDFAQDVERGDGGDVGDRRQAGDVENRAAHLGRPAERFFDRVEAGDAPDEQLRSAPRPADEKHHQCDQQDRTDDCTQPVGIEPLRGAFRPGGRLRCGRTGVGQGQDLVPVIDAVSDRAVRELRRESSGQADRVPAGLSLGLPDYPVAEEVRFGGRSPSYRNFLAAVIGYVPGRDLRGWTDPGQQQGDAHD